VRVALRSCAAPHSIGATLIWLCVHQPLSGDPDRAPLHCAMSANLRAPRKTVASGSRFRWEAQLYESTASIADGICNAQQVFRRALGCEAAKKSV